MDEDWVEKSLHPVLRLDGEGIDLVYKPLAVDHGQTDLPAIYAPAFVEFGVECTIHHSISGRLVYTADDLYVDSRAFNTFAYGLKAILEGHPVETSLSSVGSELVLTLRRDSKIRVNVCIKEWAPNHEDTVASGGRINCDSDVLYRWIDRLQSFSQYLDNWILMNRRS